MKIKRKKNDKEEVVEMEEEEEKAEEISIESLLTEDFDEDFDMDSLKTSFSEAGGDVELSIPISELKKQPLIEETYPLIDPFAYCLIQTNPQTKQTRYVVVETPLNSNEEDILRMVREIMVEELDIDFSVLKDKEKASEYLRKKLIEIVKDYGIKVSDEGFDKIFYYITRDFVGMGSIQPLLKDHMIEDISCDGVGIPIYIWHRKYESIPTNVAFNEAEELDSLIIKMAQRSGRHISVASPLLDASLPDGSRIQLTFGKEVTQRGSTFTIRKFRADPLTISDLLAFNTLDPALAAFFWFTIEHRISVLVAGGVASGKTTLLNCLSMFIKPDLKIISIEDSVAPDSELIVERNGYYDRVKIGNLVDKQIEKYGHDRCRGYEVCKINPENIRVFSMGDDGKLRLSLVRAFIRHKVSKNMFEIITSTGRRIKVTGDHSLFSLDEKGDISPIEVRKLREGDRTAVPRIIPLKRSCKVKSINLLEHIEKFLGYFVLGDPVKQILSRGQSFLLDDMKINISTFRNWVKRGIVPCDTLSKLMEEGFTFCEDDLSKLYLRGKTGGAKIPIMFPIDEDVLRLVGLWFAEGSYDKNSIIITNSEAECREVVMNVCKKFGVIVREHGDGASLMVNSCILKRLFTNVFGLKGRARTKRVPSWVFNLSDEQVSYILQGDFSGDAHVSRFEIQRRSLSLSLLKDIQSLLLRLGIISHISKKPSPRDKTYGLRISSIKNVSKFMEKIGFFQKRKNEALRNIIKRKSINDKTDSIPLSVELIKQIRSLVQGKYSFNSYLNGLKSSIGREYLNKILHDCPFDGAPIPPQVRQLATSDLLWDKVVKIKKVKNQKTHYVYDLSVPENENFLCENIVVHNTAELNIPHQNWIPSVARTGFGGAEQAGGRKRGEITMFDLLKAALRQRPDYIVVGEIRGAESYTLFQALSVGHGGLSTMHSDSVEGVIRRLESEPMNIPRAMLQALDLVAIQRKVRYRGRHIRRAIIVQEIVGTDPVTNELITNKLFAWNPKEDTFTFFGRSYTLEEISENTGMSEKDIWDEIERRKTVLRWMVKKRIANYLDVGALIREYYSNPEEMHARAVRELI